MYFVFCLCIFVFSVYLVCSSFYELIVSFVLIVFLCFCCLSFEEHHVGMEGKDA